MSSSSSTSFFSMQRTFSSEANRLVQAIANGESAQRVQAAVRGVVAKNGGRKACLDEPLDETGLPALHVAVEEGRGDIIALLLQEGASPNILNPSNGCTPLCIAARYGRHRVTQLLLTSGADVNLGVHSGWSPLCAASQKGHGIVVDQLITAGADLERRSTERSSTALMFASANGHRSVLRKLLTAGAEVNAISGTGAGAIHLASHCGYARVVEELVSGGADVEIQCSQGYTALLMAAKAGREAVIHVLLSVGADPDNGGKHAVATPLAIAASQGHSGAALELLSGGASLAKALTQARGCIDEARIVELLLAANRHHFASQSALDLMRGTDRLFGKEGRLKVSQRELSPEVLQEVAEEMA